MRSRWARTTSSGDTLPARTRSASRMAGTPHSVTGSGCRGAAAASVLPGQLALEHFAGRVPGQLLHELDLPRHLVPGQVRAHVVLDLVRRELTFGNDHGPQRLSELLVGYPDDGDLGNLRMAGEQILHLARINVL